MLVVNDRISIPDTEFDFTFARSSGPGGQNVNKVNTKVTLHWDVVNSPSLYEGIRERFCTTFHRRINKEGQAVVSSQRYRDQGRNVADCLTKLRELLLQVANPPKARKATRPTKASQRRRLDGKKKRSQAKQMRKKPKFDD